MIMRIAIIAFAVALAGCKSDNKRTSAIGNVLNWSPSEDDIESAVAYIDWETGEIHIAESNREDVAEHLGVDDPTEDEWELEDPDGNTVTVVVRTLEPGGFLRPGKNARLTRVKKDRFCQNENGWTNCQALYRQSFKITVNPHRACTAIQVGSMCTDNWKKVGEVQFYTLRQCVAGNELGNPRDYNGWVCQ